MAHLSIRLLGGPDIRLDGQPIHLETVKTLALFAYLVVRPGVHQREMLADLLWGEQGQARAQRSLRRALWNIRHSLCSDREMCPYFHISRRDVAFNRESPYTLDVETFEHHLEAVKQVTSASSPSVSAEILEHLTACVQLYRGEFLEGVYVEDSPSFSTWLLGERAYYRERVMQVLARQSEIYIARAEYDEAIVVLQRLLTWAPWSEWAHRQLMFSYALAGRRADALAQYERCRHVLREELSADPLPETIALYERIRDPRRFTQPPFQPSQAPREKDHLLSIPFFGRGDEHAWLLSHWKRRRDAITLVEGEAGIGKTRLVEEFLKYLSGRGIIVLQGRCYQFRHGAPFHPIAEALRHLRHRYPQNWPDLDTVWLAELSRLLPELLTLKPNLPSPEPIDRDAAARQRFFEAVAQVLLALSKQGLALFLDDMHWADTDTVDMLRYLIHRLKGEDVWFVIAYRGEELGRGHPFRLLRHDLGRARRLRTLRLRPFRQETARQALQEWLRLPPKYLTPLLDYLYDRSRGNPFILIEHLRDLTEQGILQFKAQGARIDISRLSLERSPYQARHPTAPHSIPHAVQDMILTRVERLSAQEQHLLELAAAFGEPFTRSLLVKAANTSGLQVDQALNTWLLRGLVHPLSAEQAPLFDFTHPLIRQVIYHHVPEPTRRRLHLNIGEALARAYAQNEDQVIESLAYHFAEGGERKRAIPYLLRAGEMARSRQAPEAAVEFYTRALDMLAEEDMEMRYRVLSGRERAYNQLARRDAQADDLDALWHLAQAFNDPARQANVLFRRAEWAMRTARFHQGLADAKAAYTLAQECGDTATLIDALRMQAMCHTRIGDFDSARRCCTEGLRWSREVGDRRREVLYLGTLGIIDLDQNRLHEARRHMERALGYWRESGKTWHYAIACNNLSMLYHRLGDYGRALALQEEARRLVPQTGDLGLDAYTLTSSGIIYHTVGRHEQALTCYEKAFQLAHIVSDRSLESYIQTCIGDTQWVLKHPEKAEQAYRRALSLEEELNVFIFRPQIWQGLALCALVQGDWDEAARCLEKADDAYRESSVPGHTLTLALYARVQVQKGKMAETRALIERFWEVETRSGGDAEPEAWWWLAQTHHHLGETNAAREAAAHASALIQQRAATLDEATRASYLNYMATQRAIIEGYAGIRTR